MTWRKLPRQDDGKVTPLRHAVAERPDSPSLGTFQRIFRDHEAQLTNFLALRLGSRADAEDAAQTVFLRLWERFPNLNSNNIPALIFVTARNLAIDLLRSRLRTPAHANDADEIAVTVKDEAPIADRIIVGRHELQLVARILQELPQKCRVAFVFYMFEELSYREIAERMSLTESMVRKYVQRATAHCAARFSQLESWE